MRSVGILLLLSGCRAIFGFESATVADATGEPDMEILPDASICADLGVTCAGETTLRSCNAIGELPVDISCNWGCVDAAEPHCGVLDPTGSVATAADLDTGPELLEQNITTAVTINGDTGAISGVRASGNGVINGIEFQQRGQIGVFRFSAVTFADQVLVRGSRPVIFVSTGPIKIQSAVDALGPCTTTTAGPGGSSGGNPAQDGQGGGRGGRGNNAGLNEVSGGGGAGHGVKASDGGDSGVQGGAGGDPVGDPEISVLVGGGGGGGGGRPGDGGGGGGGGAVFFVSNTSIQINGSINAGGCGGRAGQNPQGGGGGGGAGGAILLEAPTVSIAGQLAVNGGGGGAGGTGENGENGTLTGAATGGVSVTDGNGGNGGTDNSTAGTPGQNDDRGGGGGGAVGRIRINTRTGTVVISGSTSPALDGVGSTSTSGTALVN